MISFFASELAQIAGGQLHHEDVEFDHVVTDSRVVASGALFVAITGERFDGHDYVGQAHERGASVALVERLVDVAITQILVGDVRKAFGQLAACWRKKSKAFIVGLTGSNGKTTVKEMLSAIFRQKGKTLSTKGNLNNDLGVPMTLVRLQDHDFAIVEMGANHLGEIHYLASLVKPDIALLNNAGRAHLEGFGSFENVAKAKAEIISGLDQQGVFICYGDSQWLSLWRKLAGDKKVITFGQSRRNDVWFDADEVITSWDQNHFQQLVSVHALDQQIKIKLSLAGKHNLLNACAAIAVAQEAGMRFEAVQRGFAELKPIRGRLYPIQTSAGRYLIDDTYNANMESVKASMDVAALLSDQSIFVLGELAELPEDAEHFYQELGDYAKTHGIERLLTLGANTQAAIEAFGKAGACFNSVQALVREITSNISIDRPLVIKGSRVARMERVVESLEKEGEKAC